MTANQPLKIPPHVTQASTAIDRLTDVLKYLYTHDDGCSWTRAQTHQTLVPYLIEEAYETAETIDRGGSDDALRDELGDVLLQVVYHSEIARSRGAFTFDDVAQAITDKLVRRYPTILGDEPNTLKTPEEIDRRWNEIKAEERKRKGIVDKEPSALDGISHALPALVRASKLKDRAAKTGWEWPDTSMLMDKISEEVAELKAEIDSENVNIQRVADEFGDLLFLLVDFARLHGFDAEEALRITNNRIETRFRYLESHLRKNGIEKISDASLEQKRQAWSAAKAHEKEQSPKK